MALVLGATYTRKSNEWRIFRRNKFDSSGKEYIVYRRFCVGFFHHAITKCFNTNYLKRVKYPCTINLFYKCSVQNVVVINLLLTMFVTKKAIQARRFHLLKKFEKKVALRWSFKTTPAFTTDPHRWRQKHESNIFKIVAIQFLLTSSNLYLFSLLLLCSDLPLAKPTYWEKSQTLLSGNWYPKERL